MKAEFYLLNRSFETPSDITLEDLESKLNLLEQDYMFIRKNKADTIKVHESIYSQHFFGGCTVEDVLYCGKLKGQISRDTLEQLRNIVLKSTKDTISPEEVIEKA